MNAVQTTVRCEDVPILTVEGVSTEFLTPGGPVRAVDAISFSVRRGETLGLVGESGSGKSVLGRTIMGLVASDETVRVTGSVCVAGHAVHEMSASARRRLWGPQMAMVFQDPLTSLNPVKKVGAHLREPLRRHFTLSRKQAHERATELLHQVGIPEPRRRLDQYPHELSGGMRQRVVIAMALACEPKVLIADEPTTALDVTVQRQILDLLGELASQTNMATVLITHDLGVVEGRTDRVAVMYSGKIVETATTTEFFQGSVHPYSDALLSSIPRLADPPHRRLRAIDGLPPDPMNRPAGCSFQARCPHVVSRCATEVPKLAPAPGSPPDGAHLAACHRPIARGSGPEEPGRRGRPQDGPGGGGS